MTNDYAAGLSEHPNAAAAVGEVVGQIIDTFGDDPVDLVVVFVSPHHLDAFDDIATAVRRLLSPAVLIGQSAVWIAGGGTEVEDGPALSVFAARLPDSELEGVQLEITSTPDGSAVTGWPDHPPATGTLVLLAEPFTFPVEAFLDRTNEFLPGVEVVGGLASAADRPGGNRLVLDGTVVGHGAVGVFIRGVDISTVVSQGCRPVGRPFTVTRCDGRVLQELGGRPAFERLRDLAGGLTEHEQFLLQHGLHLGVVVNEHHVDFERGDFLIRGVLGGDPDAGTLTVGEDLTVGMTVQFQVRDASGAHEDLAALLDAESDLPVGAALLFTCNGRGTPFFGEPGHDAGGVQLALGPLPLAGCFCAGEIGPVGGRAHLHGFTASIAVFH